jgi:hypothetical protein
MTLAATTSSSGISARTPVLVEISAIGVELGFHAARRYSLISPASLARRRLWPEADFSIVQRLLIMVISHGS